MSKRWFARRSARLGLLVVVIVAVAAGVAYAAIPDSGAVYTGCMLKNIGTVRLIDPSLPAKNLMSHCTSLETQISWNQKGQPGAPGAAGAPGPAGTSVTSAAEPAGANCATGGSKFTAANASVTYACNGAKGDKGDTGADGAPGPAGPTSLAALQGSPCTFNGNTSTVNVSTDNTTGAISVTCTPVYEVSFSVVGPGTMTQGNFVDLTLFESHKFEFVSSASTLLAKGTVTEVQLQSGTDEIGGGSPFTFSCNGGPATAATAVPGFVSGTNYTAQCDTTLSGDYAVTATFTN